MVLKRGVELKRTQWRRAPAAVANNVHGDREQLLLERAARAMASVVAIPSVMACSTRHISPVPKPDIVRSRAYRMAVAQLPCIFCGVAGFSQCAHANTGKGMATKSCDLRSFPLCACRPGTQGCHARFDQGALFSKHARRLIEVGWIADTQRRLHAMGLWPAQLPQPKGGQL